MKQKGTKNITYTQRLQLESYLKAKLHKKEIAIKLGVCLATVYNEIKRGQHTKKKISYTDWFGDKHYKEVISYSPEIAEEKYRYNLTTHGVPLKIGNDYDFIHYMEKRVIVDKIAPCAVLGEIKRYKMFNTDISKTTLYRYIELGIFYNIRLQNLPFKRKKKKYRTTIAKRPPKGTSIEKRSIEIAKRNTFGHWEMDCVLGKREKGDTLLVLTERLTRYELILKMPSKKAVCVVKSLNKLEKRYGKNFRSMFKSITVDNGSEFADFVGLEKSMYGGQRTLVYYCHPYSSCERGSNERINRDIRIQIPKGTDIKNYTDKQIQFIQDWVNNYPREMFGYGTSADEFKKQIALIS